MAFWELYKKELRNTAFAVGTMLVFTLGYQLYLYTRIPSQGFYLFGGSIFLVFIIYPIYFFSLGYRTFSQEWKDQTIYFLKMLPRRGTTIVGAKFLAAVTGILLLVGAGGLSTWVVGDAALEYYGNLLPKSLSDFSLGSSLILVGIGYVWTTLFFYFLAQLAVLVSRFYEKFRWAVSFVVFILGGYISLRLTGVLAGILNWLPKIDFHFTSIINNEQAITTLSISSGAFLALGIILALLWIGNGLLLEKALEV
ncbi:MAG: hypothetical protein ACQEQG_09185 [Bacillota bacterium]